MLEDLGPTYVKVGQMLATRGDVLPEAWNVELATLQTSAKPFPWDDVRSVIIAELGGPPEVLFGSIDPVPFAAASTAQVHRATLPDGTPVVVKVQRPGIGSTTRADLGVLQQLAAVAEQRFAVARRAGATDIVDAFADSVLEELDFRTEAYNARRLADAMARVPEVEVPTVYREWSSQHILTETGIGYRLRAPDG